jgi:hypothetical protein
MPTDRAPEHNYVRKICAMARAGVLPCTIGVHEVSVYHDAWCGIYRGARCNCDPEIEIASPLPSGAAAGGRND